jgi:hypothetical protein
VREGRTYGPQHEIAVLEALVSLGDWAGVRAALPQARADLAGNALLGPWCDRAAGLAAAASGRRRDAQAGLRRAVRAFDRLGERFEAARTREELAAVSSAADSNALLRAALEVYEQLGAAPAAGRVRARLRGVN